MFEETNEIGYILIQINNNSFDKYNRSYPKFTTLLAEIFSIIKLITEIVNKLYGFVLNKKMSTL